MINTNVDKIAIKFCDGWGSQAVVQFYINGTGSDARRLHYAWYKQIQTFFLRLRAIKIVNFFISLYNSDSLVADYVPIKLRSIFAMIEKISR